MDKFLFKSADDFKKFLFTDPFDFIRDSDIELLFGISLVNALGQTHAEYADSLADFEDENFIDADEFRSYDSSLVPKKYPCIMVTMSALHPNADKFEFEFVYQSDFE